MSDILRVRKNWNQSNFITDGEEFFEVSNVLYYMEKDRFVVKFTSNNKIFEVSKYYLNGSIIDKFMWYIANHKSKIILYHRSISAWNYFKIKLTSYKINSYEKTLLRIFLQGVNQSLNISFEFNDIWKNAYHNYNKNNFIQPKNTSMKLYKYQGNAVYWMKEVEKRKINFKIDTNYLLNPLLLKAKSKSYFFDPEKLSIQKESINKIIQYSGGILADEMGLGKTICCASLIVENTSNILPITKENDTINIVKKNGLLYCPATLILLPSQLAKQWEFELKKFNKNLKIILFLTRVQHKKYTVEDLVSADVIIVTNQFLCNKRWYSEIVKKKYSDNYSRIEHVNFSSIKTKLKTEIETKTDNELINETCNLLNRFYFHRIIVDEAHEILSGSEHNYNNENIYLKNLYLSLDSDNFWYVSGTPFVNYISLFNIFKFIKVSFNENNNLEGDLLGSNTSIKDFYLKFLEKLYIRHTKESIKDQLDIPNVIEENILLEFTDIERALYEKAAKYHTDLQLRQICCHPSINDLDREAFSGTANIPNLLETKEKIIKLRKSELRKYEINLENLIISNSNHNFENRKKELETKIKAIKYILKTFENINIDKDEEDVCPITLEPYDEGVITVCGHKFSKEGLLDGIKYTGKRECPLCRRKLSAQDIFETSEKKKEENKKTIDDYTYKYGTKMGKLIKLIKQITQNKENRIIIFSQWDSLLNLISNTLKEIEINNVRCKGTAYHRNAAIMKFKKGLESKKKIRTAIILLSLENAASGTNLTEATHIFLLDPIRGTKESVKATEDQAIGRAHRVGQKNQVKIYRLLIKNTIEEKIFNECYC